MRLETETTLAQEFLADHRVLTRGLSALVKALENDEIESAIRLADELDQQVGPHIRFEEEFFYREVAKYRGEDYVDGLLHEHEAGRSALRILRHARGTGRLSPVDKRSVLAGLRTALDHAVSCGTLLSHVTTLDEAKQQDFLRELRHLQDRGGRWTDGAAKGQPVGGQDHGV